MYFLKKGYCKPKSFDDSQTSKTPTTSLQNESKTIQAKQMQHHHQVYHLVHPQSYKAGSLALIFSCQQLSIVQPSPSIVDSPKPTLPNSCPDDKCLSKITMTSKCIDFKFDRPKTNTASLLKCQSRRYSANYRVCWPPKNDTTLSKSCLRNFKKVVWNCNTRTL